VSTTHREVRSAALISDLPRLPQHMISTTELALVLGVPVRHVRGLVSERRIPFYKWRRSVRFDPDEIAVWLHDARVPPADVPEPRRSNRPGQPSRRT
jgi:excisionase family DNA binding protein